MFNKSRLWLRQCGVYWGELLKESADISEKVGGAGEKVVKWAIILTPSAIVAYVAKVLKWTTDDTLRWQGGFLIIWIFFLMLVAAFKKHRKQEAKIAAYEQEKIPKLEIAEIVYHNSMSMGWPTCAVRIRNMSNTSKVENVHVRISGNIVEGVLRQGVDPFSDADLVPATGERTLNPDSLADFQFHKPLLEMLVSLERGLRSQNPQNSVDQAFVITASGANSPPTSVSFSIQPEHGRPQGRITIHRSGPQKLSFIKQSVRPLAPEPEHQI